MASLASSGKNDELSKKKSDHNCVQESRIDGAEVWMQNIAEKLDQLIDLIRGKPEDPTTGFIYRINVSILGLQTRVEALESARNDQKKNIGAAGSALVGGAISLIVTLIAHFILKG
jgi:hypothetical protein